MARTTTDDDEGEVVSVTVRFPAALHEALKKQVKTEERALNTVVVRACRAYLAEHGDLTKALGVFKGPRKL